MSIASLILGIVCIVLGTILGWIPFVGFIFPILALIGLILGIVDTAKKSKTNESKGVGIAGIVTSSIGLIISIFMFFISGVLSVIIFSEM